MSLESWEDEFYPMTAKETLSANLSMIEIIKHSLKKWIGLKKENIDKHDINSNPFCNDRFEVNEDSCSLCVKYYREHSLLGECRDCPIVKATGKTCLRSFEIFEDNYLPEPMIDILKETLSYHEKELIGMNREKRRKLENG